MRGGRSVQARFEEPRNRPKIFHSQLAGLRRFFNDADPRISPRLESIPGTDKKLYLLQSSPTSKNRTPLVD